MNINDMPLVIEGTQIAMLTHNLETYENIVQNIDKYKTKPYTDVNTFIKDLLSNTFKPKRLVVTYNYLEKQQINVKEFIKEVLDISDIQIIIIFIDKIDINIIKDIRSTSSLILDVHMKTVATEIAKAFIVDFDYLEKVYSEAYKTNEHKLEIDNNQMEENEKENLEIEKNLEIKVETNNNGKLSNSEIENIRNKTTIDSDFKVKPKQPKGNWGANMDKNKYFFEELTKMEI